MAKNVRLIEFKDEEVYPITMSADGTNAFYCDFCPHAGYRPGYASCLRRIEDRKLGRLDSNEAQCSSAIGNGYCMAAKMQQEEIQQGHAMYYLNRIKMREVQVENADVMGFRLGKSVTRNLSNPSPRIGSPQELERNIPKGIPDAPEFKTGSYADAINAKLKALDKKESASSTSPSSKVVVESKKSVSGDLAKKAAPPLNTQGLSLLEIARLRKQQAQA